MSLTSIKKKQNKKTTESLKVVKEKKTSSVGGSIKRIGYNTSEETYETLRSIAFSQRTSITALVEEGVQKVIKAYSNKSK